MRTLTIEFGEYPGDEYVVRISPVPVDDLFAVNDALGTWNTRKGMTALRELFAPFVESCPGDDSPTAATLGRLDINLLLALAREWQRGVAQVPLPLPVTSSDGTASETPEAPSPNDSPERSSSET